MRHARKDIGERGDEASPLRLQVVQLLDDPPHRLRLATLRRAVTRAPDPEKPKQSHWRTSQLPFYGRFG